MVDRHPGKKMPHRLRGGKDFPRGSPGSARLLAVVTVNAAQTIRSVSTDLLGINASPYDQNLSTTQTATLTTALGTTSVRASAADRMLIEAGTSTCRLPAFRPSASRRASLPPTAMSAS